MRELVALSLAVCGLCFAVSAADWHVPNATVRVTVSVAHSPDDPQLGVFVKVPDGGLLPSPWAVPQAVDEDGKSLETVLVGYNQKDGVGVLFEPPKNDRAFLYFSQSQRVPAKPANAKIFPSLILYTKNGRPGLDNAKAMSTQYPPAQGAFFASWDWAGSMVNPFGPDDNYNLWFVGAILLEKPEKIYFATVSDEGSEFSIDGKKIAAWPGKHTRDGGAKGQHGDHVQLSKGLHRIDYYQFELTGKQEAQLVWKRPGIETKSGLPELVDSIAKSGVGDIERIELKDGRACTTINISGLGKSGFASVPQAASYFWFGDQPITLFKLTAGPFQRDEKIFWEFGKGKRLQGHEFACLVSGQHDPMAYPITLALENAKGTARTTRLLQSPWTPNAASIDNPDDRLEYRKAFYDLARAVPAPGDPCADWSNDFWGLFCELLEPYKSGTILSDLFTRGFASIQKRPDKERWMMQDRFIEFLRIARKDKELLEWIATFEKAEHNNARKFHWKEERIATYLFDLNTPEPAKREISSLKDNAASPDQQQYAELRAGDVAYATGDLEAALKHYKDAEDRYRSRNKTGMAGGRLSYVGGRKARASTNDIPKKASAKESRYPQAEKNTASAKFKLPTAPKGEEWKIYTVRNSSRYATISSLLEQNALPEALQEMANWESESPTSKLEGEYPIAAARVYQKAKDFRRAANILDLYTRNTGMSAQLPDAIKLEIECLGELNDTERQRKLAKDFLKRFPGHPFEEEMKGIAQ